MPNGKMTTRDYIMQLIERVDGIRERNGNFENELKEVKKEIKDLNDGITNLKIKVYLVAGSISVITTLIIILLNSMLSKGG